MNYALGLICAEHVKALLQPFCDRVEIAGGIRRKKQDPHDIEIVCIPKFVTTTKQDGLLPGEEKTNVLDVAIQEFLEASVFQHGEPSKNGAKAPCGDRYYRLKYQGEKVDIFAVIPPAQFGTVFLIRTGDAEFSHAFVTRLWKFGLRSRDGHIEDTMGLALKTPEENDAFRLCKMDYIEPENRTIAIFQKVDSGGGTP
jgi:DNA polymerase/3'-5' exonuclease PolX